MATSGHKLHNKGKAAYQWQLTAGPGLTAKPGKLGIRSLTYLCSAVLALTCSTLFAGWQAPLSPDEQVNATSAALNSVAARSSLSLETAGQQKQSAGLQSRTRNDLPGNLPQLQNEVLLVELKHSKKNQLDRIAEVFVFDYNRGVTELHLINMENNQVTDVIAVASTHLPLNNREQQVATALATNHDSVKQQLQAEYQRAFGRTLESLDLLDMKVSIWQPPPHLANSHDFAATCNTERCALVSVFTRDNYSFSLEPVVNLMQGTVHPEVLR